MTAAPPRAKGCKPSTPHKLGAFKTLTRDDVARRLGVSFVPSSDMDLSGFTPRRSVINGRTGSLNQGGTSSCTTHSRAGALVTAAGAQGVSLLAVPSPDLPYKGARALERAAAVPPNGTLPELVDAGAEFADVSNAESEYGMIPMGTPPPDGRYSDCDPATINDEVDVPLLERAGYALVTGPYRLALGPGQNVVTSVKALLAAKIPLWVAFYCDTPFENLKKGDVAQAPIVSDAPGEGGHASYLSAGENTPSGFVGLLEGSWGNDFCDGGSALVGEAWLENAWEIWPLIIRSIGPRRASVGKAAF